VELTVTWARLNEEPVLASYEVGVNDSLAGRIVWTDSLASGANLEFNWAHPLFDPLRRHQSSDSQPAPSHAAASHARETLDPSSHEWQLHRVELYGLTRLPDWDELLGFNVEDLATDREHGIESPGSPNLPRFRALVSGVFIGIGDTLRNELARLRYIGPMRKLRPRVQAEPGSADQESWSDGSAAWNRLLPAPPDPSRPDLLKEVNDWLARNDRLDTGYKLRRRSTVELPADEDPVRQIRFLDRLPTEYRNDDGEVDPEHWVRKQSAEIADLVGCDPDPIEARIKARHRDGDESVEKETPDQDDPGPMEMIESSREIYRFLTDCVAAVDDIEKGGSAVKALVRAIADAHPRTKLELVTAGSEMPVRTPDIGVGISQILPVVVAALDPQRPGITAIEQPELHVHPKMQVELGDLFAQGVERARIFLIETHSEHLLLRFMKRMRQASDGTLPDGAPEVRPENIAVYFVEIDSDAEQTLVREMPLNERGELVEAWPGGFFEEDLREIF
jgi:hypothetical protein